MRRITRPRPASNGMKSFEVKGKIWRYEDPSGHTGGWFFVYVPEALSRNKKKVGFHFVRVKAALGKTTWQTALFPTKDGPYLLAIKADVRRKEGVGEGDTVRLSCSIL